MIYTPMIKTALNICYDAHRDQIDKGNVYYVFHPFHLAEQMESEEEIIVALLHDVLEDSDYTISQLAAYGFSDEVLKAILILSRGSKEVYMDYIYNIKYNSLARKVKIADLKHNMDTSRFHIRPSLLKRYEKALNILKNTGVA